MSRRSLITMEDHEIRTLLDAQEILILATIGSDGMPHLAPMWFAWLDDALAFWTYAKSQKARNLERDARMTVLVETGSDYADYRGVSMQGKAELQTDPASVERIGLALAQRYGQNKDADTVDRMSKSAPKRVGVVFRPTRIASWDHRKLGSGVY